MPSRPHTYKFRKNLDYRDIHAEPNPAAREGLKSSHRDGQTATHFTAHGGWEDCQDVVRGGGYRFEDGDLHALPRSEGGTKDFITVKGGVQGAVWRDIRLHGRNRFPWHIAVGGHTIYDDESRHEPPSRGIVFDRVRFADNPRKRVVILCLHAERPQTLNGRYLVIKVPLSLVRRWFAFRRWLARRGK